jgi:hypothetical protein
MTVSIIDISRYDFGLYYALLAIVGLTAAIAVCVVRPKRGCCTRDPKWYTRCFDRLHDCLIAGQQRAAMYKSRHDGNTASQLGDGERRSANNTSNIIRQQRTTLIMLRPAVELMQHMLNGLGTRDEHEHSSKDEESTSDATDEVMEGSPKNRRGKSKKKKKKKKLLIQTSEACLYTILETSTADVTVVQNTEATSVVTVHECYPQLLNESIPNSPTGCLTPTGLVSPPGAGKKQNMFFPQKKHLLHHLAIANAESPKIKLTDGQNVFTFQKHDILSETLDEEGFSETRCSSVHE